MSVPDIDKPGGKWCTHCDRSRGCNIYEKRPQTCRDFVCAFLVDPTLDERWRPSTARFVLVVKEPGRRATVCVDPQRPDAWRREPYLSTLRAWSKTAVERRGLIDIFVGGRSTAILPDKEVDLGIVAKDEVIMTYSERTPTGVRYHAVKLKRPTDAPT
jgi:hypothetical protein